MPVFAVKSFGVSEAMSFICGLSTIATLMVPPFFEPEAGDPPEFELEPPQPTIPPRTATTATADPRRRVPLIVLPLLRLGQRGGSHPSATEGPLIALVYVG